MKFVSERVSVKKNPTYTTIVILPYSTFWISALMGGWLSMWLVIGIAVISSFFIFQLSYQEQLILWVFLTFWIYYLIKIGRTFLWIKYGKELIKLDQFSFHYKRSLFNYGKMHEVFYENIREIETHFPKENSFESIWESSPWISGGERIKIKTNVKNYNLGRKLSKSEATPLVDLIKNSIKRNVKAEK
jgi:hypothetical protein